MQFFFFSPDDKMLFVRDDAEQAQWQEEELSLNTLFPFVDDKKILRGMRIGFFDQDNTFQAFEIRKVRTYEPDHYQEVTAEHIAVSELTDEHFAGAEITGKTATQVLTQLLTGTLWQVGNVGISTSTDADLSKGSVWQNVRTVEKNWNCYIMPRVTISANGISGRYLDVISNKGMYHGLRLSIDKDTDELGITWDDTNVATALYGYGANSQPQEGQESQESEPITFASVTWEKTADHPAKPAGQTYIEDPEATSLYGRNGRPRFGYFQNSSIDNPETLLQYTWDTLKGCNKPAVSIDCLVRELYRLGYDDVPLHLHDQVYIEVRPTGEMLQQTIIKVGRNLLDPTATRLTIGAYIPNIVYINRNTARNASGGESAAASGLKGTDDSTVKTESDTPGGRRGQNNNQRDDGEFYTEMQANAYQISLRAYQRDLNDTNENLREAGIQITAQGVKIDAQEKIVDEHGKKIGENSAAIKVEADRITAEVTRATEAEGTMSSRITQTADAITAEVTRATEAEGELSGRLTVTADAVTAEVKRAKEAESTLKVTADGITADVNNFKDQTSAQFKVQAGEISSKVSNSEYESYVKQTADTIEAHAQNIKLNGDNISLISKNYVQINKLQSEIANLGVTISNGISTAGIVAQTGSITDFRAGTFHVSGDAYSKHTISIDGVAKATFLGSADVNFDRAAAEAAGKAAMGLSFNTSGNTVSVAESSTKSAAVSTSYVGPTYSTTNHNYTVVANAKVGSAYFDTKTITTGTEAYDAGYSAGKNAVTVSASWDSRTLSYSDGTYSLSYNAAGSNGASDTKTLSFSATQAYNDGYAAYWGADGWGVGGAVTIPSQTPGGTYTWFTINAGLESLSVSKISANQIIVYYTVVANTAGNGGVGVVSRYSNSQQFSI